VPIRRVLDSTSTEDLPVVLGPRLDNYSFRREDALLFDKFHFKSSVRSDTQRLPRVLGSRH